MQHIVDNVRIKDVVVRTYYQGRSRQDVDISTPPHPTHPNVVSTYSNMLHPQENILVDNVVIIGR